MISASTSQTSKIANIKYPPIISGSAVKTLKTILVIIFVGIYFFQIFQGILLCSDYYDASQNHINIRFLLAFEYSKDTFQCNVQN